MDEGPIQYMFSATIRAQVQIEIVAPYLQRQLLQDL